MPSDCAVSKRPAGSRAIAWTSAARIAAGKSGRRSRMSGIGTSVIALNVRKSESRWNSRLIDSISYITTASAKMSLRRSSGLPRICSGDMYAFLPLTVPVRVREFAPRALAMPKSSSFTIPSAHTMMLGGDTSRCTTPISWPSVPRASCAECSPSQAWTRMPATTRKSSIFPAFESRVIMRDSGTPWRYSIAMNQVPATWPNDITWQTFLCSSRDARSASSRNIVTKCSSSAR